MNIDQFMSGIRATESGSTGGNYTAKNSRSGAYGAYQFLKKYWADFLRYSKSAGFKPTTTSWPPNKANQDTVARGMFTYYADKYDGNWDLVAVAWHCGHTCANAAVTAYGTDATPNEINSAVAKAKGSNHANEIAYIRNVYEKQGLSFNAGSSSTTTSTGAPMATVIRRGDTGDDVKNVQQALVDAGHSVKVDGVYGPATEAAIRAYQKKNGLTVDGKAGPQTMGSMGLASGQGGAGSDLNLPGKAKLWYNTTSKDWLVVYEVPPVKKADGSWTDKLYTAWTVESSEDLEGIVGVGNKAVAARSVSNGDLSRLGVVNFGGVDEFRNFEHIEGDPFDSWAEDMAVYAITQPWILDPEWARMSVMAVMEREDAQLSDAEIRSTEWWRTHSETERRWLELYNADPATADKWLEDSRNNTFQKLRESGVQNITRKMSDWIADQVTTGAWTQDYLDNQVLGLSDPAAGVKMDKNLLQEMHSLRFTPGQTQDKEDDVRSLLDKWLGPAMGTWTDKQVTDKAGDLRNDPDSETNFVESLKDQRLALWGNYPDRNASYQEIAQPWKNFGRQAWGQEMDETDPVFLQMLQQNDSALAGSLLNREGLKRNVGKVVNDTRGAVTEAFGGTVYG